MGFQTGRKPWSSDPLTPENDEARGVREKIFYFALLVILLFGILTIQLARMQLVNGEKYSLRADTNRLRQEPIPPTRGLIYDRDGTPLVENRASFAAAIVAADVPEGEESRISIAVQNFTGTPATDIETLIDERRASNDPFTPVVVKENLSTETAFAIREKLATLPGVRVVVEPIREYKEGELLSHIVGFVGPLDEQEFAQLETSGYSYDDRIGKAGVEYTYEALLRGIAGTRFVETDASGREIEVIEEVDAVAGKNVILSIDIDLQRKVEEILRGGMGKSKNAAAIVIDVNTGDILSMVSLPNYDSNIFSGEVDQRALERLTLDPAKPMLNHAISEMYAPGSTFKQITGLAALQEGVANAGTTVFSPGYLDVENEYLPGKFDRFRDWRNDLGTMNFYRGLAMSSDVYYYYLSGGYIEDGKLKFQGLGVDRLAGWAERFGLGESTGIDLPGESEGLVPNSEWKEQTIGEGWLLGDTYNFGIGQGYVAATPLQMLLVTAAVANGGNVLVPHVVKELTDVEGKPITLRRNTVKRNLNIDARNLNIMREAMRQSVADGAAFTAAVRNVVVAGKTGTAEFGEEIAPGRYREHGWFTGYAPFSNPEIAVVVFVEEGNGSGTAAPIASKIIDFYYNQLNAAEGSR
ncbi:MAG TPA: penicillin-binding protein 2 [Dehalococcoidia bacterium]|jgi:penicillin-binding protein 2|nr:penicillin-binding protein 2 [Dehalococcoidia bacterium]